MVIMAVLVVYTLLLIVKQVAVERAVPQYQTATKTKAVSLSSMD